jgi:hypothetical protein
MSRAEQRVARAIGETLSRDSRGNCLLCSTDEQDLELARAAISACHPILNSWVVGTLLAGMFAVAVVALAVVVG